MTNSQKQTSPIVVWCYGLGLILLWLAIPGQNMNQYLQKEQQQYARSLGEDNGTRIIRTGQRFYNKTVFESGVQGFLFKHTTPDRKMGEGLATTIEFFQGVVRNFLTLLQQLFYRIALLIACFPYWGIVLLAALLDGWLIRKIRYHDFHYTSPLRNLWSRRLCRWIPGLFLYLVMIPLPFPVWLLPVMAWLTTLSLGWWTANWQKRV
ncbi:DUF4400 domain-containing protein [Endozoicomonas euniceicola]|uniref:DUF4400 domain-containing protein n=1 Tax=Endozoicomonas euniceicola TaxID=1234143 RepID=A0ABY6GSY6_9GAMM|nr:DUF4400 domain-containing protein [Endozoicomonas euniceicola]UYM15876.1 DUF4400 domain-containing protein [Endozoicomonas euniceicola]